MKKIKSLLLLLLLSSIFGFPHFEHVNAEGKQNLSILNSLENEAEEDSSSKNNTIYIVRFSEHVKNPVDILKEYNVKILNEYRDFNIFIFESTEEEINVLKNNINVEHIEKNKVEKIINPTSFMNKEERENKRNVSSFNSISNEEIVNSHQYNIINAQKMWGAGYTGKNVNVAIIDSGLGNEWDSHPAIKDSNVMLRVSCVDLLDPCNEYSPAYDVSGHGTHVAGIIAGQHNSYGNKGIAPDVKLFSFNIFVDETEYDTSSLLKALNTIYQWNLSHTSSNDIHIVNMSIGGSYSFFIKEMIEKIYEEQDVVFVASAGNGGQENGVPVTSFAQYDEVIGVINVGNNLKRHVTSSYGENLDISAPGENIISSVPFVRDTETYIRQTMCANAAPTLLNDCLNFYWDGTEDGYNKLTGTSMSAPFVTGYLALLKEQFPNDSAQALREKLLFNTVPRPSDLNEGEIGYNEYGNGILQAVPYGVKSTVTVTSNTDFYQIPDEDFLSSYKVTKDTEMKVYLEWKNPVDSTDAWLKLQNGYWIKSSILQIVGEPIATRDVYVDENTKAYAFPWEGASNIDLSEHVIQGIYPSSRGYIETGLSTTNSKIIKNYLWYQVTIGEHTMWVKAHAVHELKSIQYITFQTTESLYDYPSLTSPKQSYSRGYTIYSYDGYDYNQDEKRFNWYSINTSQGLKWYPSQYHLYQTQKLPESNGFEDGIITSWNDYMTSDFIQNWKVAMRADTFNHAQFEESKLFSEQDFNAIYQQYKHYPYRYIAIQKRIGSNDHVVSLFFSNAEMYVDNTGSFSIYRARDNSNFIRVTPSKNDNSVRHYVVNNTRSSDTNVLKRNLDITLYELNLN